MTGQTTMQNQNVLQNGKILLGRFPRNTKTDGTKPLKTIPMGALVLPFSIQIH
jgi:hypothetical protein